jgi:hypothetical protein
MQHKINGKCAICSKPIMKCENTCSCLPCNKKNRDCEECFNDVFYCMSCILKISRNTEMKDILIERRKEKLEEVTEIEKMLEMFTYEKDIMFQ